MRLLCAVLLSSQSGAPTENRLPRGQRRERGLCVATFGLVCVRLCARLRAVPTCMKAPRFPLQIRRGSVTVHVYRFERTGGRSVFTVSWYAAGVRRTKQFAESKAAIEEANAQADAIAAGRVTVAASGLSVEDAALLASLKKRANGTPLAVVVDEWRRAHDLTDGQVLRAAREWRAANVVQVRGITTPDAVRLFIAAKKRQGVDTTTGYENILPRLAARFPGQISTVSAAALERAIHEEFRQGESKTAHPVTYNTCRKRVVALWRWCRKNGHLPRLAQTEAEQLEQAREMPAEIGILRVQDFAAALAVIQSKHPEHLAVTVLAGFCGLRRSELHAQLWSDVHLDRGFVRVTKAKRNTPSKRLVPLCPAAIEWLMECQRPAEPDALISPPWGVDRLRKFLRGASIPCPENGFRHAFISHRVAQTGNVAETSLEAGNSPAIVHRHYRALVAKSDGECWFGLSPIAVKEFGRINPLPTGAVA